jgi:hypothetical protein
MRIISPHRTTYCFPYCSRKLAIVPTRRTRTFLDSGHSLGSQREAALFFERNGFQQPKTTVVDLRLSKRFNVADRVKLEFLGEAFNVANHQNVTTVNTTAYTVASTTATKTNTLTYTTAVPTFGAATATNTSGFSYAPRQIQLGVRAQF